MVSEISPTVDIKPKIESANAGVNVELALPANSQPTDLRFNMYSDKKTESPKTMFRTNADPYIGSGVHPEHLPANGETLIKQEIPNPLPTTPFVSTSTSSVPQQTNDLIAAAFSSYLNTAESPADANSDSINVNSSVTRNRPGSGPPLKYETDSLVPVNHYRPSSANIFTTINRGPNSDVRGSPNFIQQSSNFLPSKIPSPALSPASQTASPAERPHSTNLVPAVSDYAATSSAFKPLPASQSSQNHSQQVYSHHTPSPHSYHHGPSPPLTG